MSHPADPASQIVLVLSTLGLSLGCYLSRGDSRIVLTAVFVATLVGVFLPLARIGDITTAAPRVFSGIAGPFYVGGALATLMLLRRDFGPTGPALVLLVLVIAWIGDTGGYAFGSLLGGRKLYAAVSPKKTVAGFVGSLLMSTLGSLVTSLLFLPNLGVVGALGLGVFGGAMGQLGDLAESLLKRSTGVKDSGRLIPGHGGVLDRIDAILVVAPVVYVYSVWA